VSERSDPRGRPSDPAGTQPKVDPEALFAREAPALTSGAPPDSAEAFRGLPQPREGEPPREGGGARLLPEKGDDPAPLPARAGEGTHGRVPHAPRFQFLFGALGALGVGAIALAVSLALAPTPTPGVPWAGWGPSGDVDPAVQIAAHVEPQYLLSPGRHLVGVTGGPQAIGGQPVVVALRSSGSAPVPLAENGVFYQLCGDGPNCSIPGKPSIERGLLVRREALELALYTFHYVGGASQVIVTYPPVASSSNASGSSKTAGGKRTGKGSGASTGGAAASASGSTGGATTADNIGGAGAPSRVLLFRPGDLSAELSKPLDETLSEATPTVATMARAPEAAFVNELTEKLLYDSVLVPESQTSSVLLLQQPSIGG
jgi:hypothetical protein